MMIAVVDPDGGIVYLKEYGNFEEFVEELKEKKEVTVSYGFEETSPKKKIKVWGK